MIVIKYNKVKRTRYISHIDMLKHITRTIRRMGIDIEYSQGFNPHMLIKLSAPCPLGISSISEYMAVECKNIDASEFLRLYNKYCLEDLIATNSWETDKNPNFQGIVAYADYMIECEEELDFSDIMNNNKLEITYDYKGKEITKDVRAQIEYLQYKDNKIFMRLALGNNTLRPDRLLEHINQKYEKNLNVSDIVKTNQYTIIDNELVDFDKYLDKMV